MAALQPMTLFHSGKTPADVAKATICAALGKKELVVTEVKKPADGVVFPYVKTADGEISGGNAIARYLAMLCESGLYPRAPFDEEKRMLAGAIDSWTDKSISVATAVAGGESSKAGLAKMLAALDENLNTSSFAAGAKLTLADVCYLAELAPALKSGGVDLSVIPKVAAWVDRVSAVPEVKAALGDVKPKAKAAGGQAAGGGKDADAAAAKKAAKKAAKEAEKAAKAAKKAAKPQQKPKEKKAGGGGGGGKEGKKKETKLGLSIAKEDDFGNWYANLCVESELISYYAVSGCYILRPAAYTVWEFVTRWFDAEIKKLGVQNAYFPLFITEDVLIKEKDHIEDFAPEVAWVTKSGGSDMDKPIAIRPTSETVMYPYYADWIRSHRDLPLKLNQWTNVVRWEFKHPTPFIRSREFLWQEGHTAFATQEEAAKEVLQILDLYRRIYEELMAVPVCPGTKSKKEKFAGSLYSTTVEAYIPAAGRGVQAATSHCLGQNFSKMFDIQYETESGGKAYAWQNSWGCTTRSIGVMIMTHSDNKGLVMPPNVAPTQVVFIPIPNSKMPKEEQEKMFARCEEMKAELERRGVRCTSDMRQNYTPGWKYNHWEVKGVPIRVELGPKDMEKQQVVLARRDTGAKSFVGWDSAVDDIVSLLPTMQADMLAAAREKFDAAKETAHTWDEFKAALDRQHMILTPWADEEEIEDEVKKASASADAMGAKTLCIPMEQPPLPEGTKCFWSGKPAKNWVLWGRSY